MNPAASVILFTTLSGLGFGFLAFLGLGLVPGQGWTALALWFVGYALAVGGLVVSTLHLGNPRRALRAFSQWRSSWLSREAWAAVLTLMLLAPLALSDIFGFGWPRLWGVASAAMCAVTVFTTSMIYAQLKTVPRWNHWITPVMFLSFAVTGGALLSGRVRLAVVFLLGLGIVQVVTWVVGDGRFRQVGASMGSASGLGSIGTVRVFEQPHTGPNYLMREMIFVVGRKHVAPLRTVALVLLVAAPLAVLALSGRAVPGLALAAVFHLGGALASRWLFFAQAEHVVGLYYGQR